MIIKYRFPFDILLFTVISFWCIGIVIQFIAIFIPPLITLSPLLKYNFSIVCHAEVEKLICINAACTFTCARCTGIYFGALFFSILFLARINLSITLKFMLLSSLPMMIDIILYSISIYKYSIFIAFTTGMLLGSTGFIYIRSVLLDFLNKNIGKN